MIITFCIGSLIGSFLTLAVYRVPLKQDITHKRSFCPKCNHKLGFLDLVPILSYLFLGGKCRYCKEKIRLRYLILEIFSGLLFTLFVYSLKINLYVLQLEKIIYLYFGTLYIIGVILIAGIDKEYKNINKGAFIYLVLVILGYMTYLYVLKFNIYRYGIYLLISIILFILNRFINHGNIYMLDVLSLGILILAFSGEQIFLVTCIISLLLCSVKKIRKTYNLGFLMCISNLLVMLIHNFIVGDFITWLI